jgi:hypothetical protein
MFYFSVFMQLLGLSFVSVCLFTGISKGDYGKIELFQFIWGSLLFYSGHYLRMRGGKGKS